MKRVPVMEKNNYLEYLFKDFPVLFVESYKEINEEFLINHNHLFEMAINLDVNKLDLNLIFKKHVKNI